MDTKTVAPTSSIIFGWDYDVTLSYAEEEETTENNFIGNLYASLEKAKFKTFKDNNPARGDQLMISDTLKKGIEGSRCAVIIFSRNFASSTRCLEEVSLMMECKNKFGHMVFPVFLMDVEGSHVRNQKGSFEEPFRKHEQCFKSNLEVVERWRSDLKMAGELAGLNFKDIPDRDEEKLIAKIVIGVSDALSEIPPLDAVTEMYTERITENQPSTQHKLQELLGYIGDPQFDIIGLYGMGGVGKTTLAKEVNNHFWNKLVRGIKIPFDIVIMVTVSSTPNIQSIRDSVAEHLKLEKNIGAGKLLENLRKKRFLLILDDVWCRLSLEDIGIPRPTHKNKGSKIVVISRNQDTCTDMDAGKTIKAEILSPVESWDLFVHKAGEHVTTNDIKHWAEEIVGRCKGLPLAIVTVARAMANRHTVGSWENALREMKQLSSSKLRGMKDDVFVPLKFSFDMLEDDMLKSLFLYCACFPEDYNIGDDCFNEMLNFCIGEGLVDEQGSLEDARAKGVSLIESLKIACMLEDGESKDQAKMHDIMRDLALWITSSDCDSSHPKHLVWTSSVEKVLLANKWLDVRRISLIWSNIAELPKLGETCQKLTTLLLNQSSVSFIPEENFFQHMNHLCILDLSQTQVKYLPQSLSYLKNLQVLRLQDCEHLIHLPPLGMLEQLQVLDVSACHKLSQQILRPEDEKLLRNLRYLNVEGSKVFILERAFDRLHNLEEARFSGAENIKWSACRGERKRGKEQKEAKEIDRPIDVGKLLCLDNLTHLTIDFESITVSDDWFKTLGDKIRHLSLKSCTVEEEALQTINQSKKLAHIRLEDCSGVTCVHMAARSTTLRRCKDLETVKDVGTYYQGEGYPFHEFVLDALPKLERILSVPPLSYFARLSHIKICSCNNLKMVFTKEMPRLLNNLRWMEIASCDKMEVIIEAVAEEEKDREIVGGVISPFPTLNSLILKDLPALHDLCSHNQTLHCPLLTKVQVDHCPMLKKDPLYVQVVDELVEVKGNECEVMEIEEI